MDTSQSLEKWFLSSDIFSSSSISEGERPLYTFEASERISEGSSTSSWMMRCTRLCSGIWRGVTGFKTPFSKIASTVFDMVCFPLLGEL